MQTSLMGPFNGTRRGDPNHNWPPPVLFAATTHRETAMPRHPKVIAAVLVPKLARWLSGIHGLDTITGGTSRRNWSVIGRFLILPTLIRQLPSPLRRMVGDLLNEKQVLVGVGLVAEEPTRNGPSKDAADDDPR